ncbi:MAG TPA: right-handed parallel beta-helix repeat-containing protein [Gammaproteobacteria bacterium]
MRFVLLCAVLGASAAAESATYYVRNGGNDSANGKSHAEAWASIDKVNAGSFGPGDEILFLSGNKWADQLVVKWSGSKSAPLVIGAYYVENGVAKRGVKGERPTIDGEDRLPQSRHVGLIEITGDYVRVENFRLINSEGRGVSFREASFGAVVGVETRQTYDSGIKLNESTDILIENNHIADSNRAYLEGASAWGSAIAGVKSPRMTVRGNTVENVYGEGINANQNSHDSLIEGNLVFGARAVGIYADSSPRVTIRRNIVLGTTDSAHWRGDGKTVGSGIVINNEKYHYAGYGGNTPLDVQATETKVYANLVAYTNQGIAFWGNLPESSFDKAEVYNNTLVDNNVQFDAGRRPKPNGKFVNNILLSLSDGTRDVAGSSLHGMTARNNYFSQGDPGGDFSHSSNVYEGLTLARMSGWRALDKVDAVTWKDFLPMASSSTIGAGDSSILSLATAKNAFDRDFNAEPHNDPIDIGALRFAPETGGPKVPKPPAAVTARPLAQ